MKTQLKATNFDNQEAAAVTANGSGFDTKALLEIDQQQLRDHVSAMVLETVEETLNALLDAEADGCATRHAMSTARSVKTRALALILVEEA